MKIRVSFLKVGFLMGCLIMTACSPEDGADGAAGPQGLQGTAGTDGLDGQDGNANVSSVLLQNVAIVVGNNNFDIPELTQDILDNGLVYAYAQTLSSTFWEPLPIATGGSIILDIDRIFVGSVQLTATFSQNLNIRFVLVAGTDVNGVDFSNYKEVENHFGF